ncbi:MAG: S41 family peptidase [Phycisphaerales bacterium]|nr:MAG: S41 family peptidase [Phycisphaerales bacterium]
MTGMSRTNSTGRSGRWAAIVVALGALVGLGLMPASTNAGRVSPTESVSVAEWSKLVWNSASTGNDRLVFNLLERLPENHDDASVRDLRAAVDRHVANESQRRERRDARASELEGEFIKNAEKNDVAKALVSAIEWSEVVSSRSEVIEDRRVAALVGRAERLARDAEAAGRWIDAQDMYFRLSMLFEETGRFRDDLRRVTERIGLLRIYVPERLHAMRNEQRVRDGEDPLPAFNNAGDDWRSKITGIDQFMVRRALLRARQSHVDNARLGDLIVGGLKSVRTFATTPDLSEAFPGMADQKAKEAFLAHIDGRLTTFRGRANPDEFDLSRALMGLLEANKNTLRVPDEAILRAFGDGALAQLDEFSGVIWPDEIPQFMRSTTGRFQGVGIQIQLDEMRNLKVVTPLEGTPAQRAGIRKNDIIREIDGESTLGVTLLQAVDRITGKAGTGVKLTVERPGQQEWIEFPLTRADIPIHTIKGWRRSGARETDWDWFVDPEHKIGYIRLTQFSEETTRDFDRAIREMRAQGLNGLVLDLRFNPGGLLREAVSIANRFVREGVIVSQHNAQGVQVDADRARPGMDMLRDIPVAVLINDGSASASEIVAGCIQDYARSGALDAVVVGVRTYGKGSVQNIYDLGRGEAILKLTERYYRLPGGRLIHRREGADTWGVEPDLSVRMLPEQISNALELRQNADIVEIDERGVALNEADRPDPARLLDEGIDTQLEVALLLLRSRALANTKGHAMLLPAGAVAGEF